MRRCSVVVVRPMYEMLRRKQASSGHVKLYTTLVSCSCVFLGAVLLRMIREEVKFGLQYVISFTSSYGASGVVPRSIMRRTASYSAS